jgi:50S ribosomal protein L16 3-hydroxylase
MLYLPPGVAHYGVAESDCMTYSIGFRAPLELDLLSAWTDHLVLSDTAQKRYSDPHLKAQTHPGELSHDAIEQFQQLMASLTQRPDEFREWLAKHFSLPAQDIDLSLDMPLTSASIIDRMKAGETLHRSEFSRFVFISLDTNSIQLFINGQLTLLSNNQAALGRLLCDQRSYIASDINSYLGAKDCCELLTDWVNQGLLYFNTDD